MKFLLGWALLASVATAEPAKLVATKWSGTLNLADPVACSVDDHGRVFVTETTRRKVADLDIREHADWIIADQKIQHIDDKIAFYHDVLAPGKLKGSSGSLIDQNKDGSVDWHDLTVPKERVWRVADTDGDGVADEKLLFSEGYNTEASGIAAGVLAFDGSVYLTVAPDLWSLEDLDDDGKSDIGKSVGPDGRIYWTIGDKGVHVKYKRHPALAQPNQGCVLRCEPDGSGFEIYAHGLRNVQEIAFDDYGNLFGVDNDADKPGEKERFVYITEQSDSGWRCGFQYQKSFCPWMEEGRWKPSFAGQPAFLTPPLATSHDGPSGFAYNPGTALGAEWQGCFFLNQFPSGKMNAIRLEATGASFKIASDEVVSSGIMGIGMSWGPDGKLYFADWIGGYPLDGKGAVWTLDDPNATNQTLRKEVQTLLDKGFDKLETQELVKLLSHPDVRIRRGGQFALAADHAWEALEALALDQSAPLLARLHALWGLGQGARDEKWEHVTIFEKLFASTETEVVAQAAKVASECVLTPKLTQVLGRLLTHAQPRVRFLTGLALGRIKCPEAFPLLLAACKAEADTDAFLRHAYVTALAHCAEPAALANLASDPTPSVRRAGLLALARLRSALCARFLHDAEPSIVQEAARAIHDDISIMDALPKLAELAERAGPAGSKLDELTQRRALNAAFRLGSAADAQRLVSFVVNESADPTLRLEALSLISLWPKPPLLDRVDGMYRELPPHDVAVMKQALEPKAQALLASPQQDLNAMSLRMLADLQIPMDAAQLLQILQRDKASESLRTTALQELARQHPQAAELKQVLKEIFRNKKLQSLRQTALPLLANLDPTAGLTSALAMTNQGSTMEMQTAWKVLGTLPSATDTVQTALANLHTKPPAVQLEILEAATSLGDKLKDGAKQIAAITEKSNFSECQEGGDVGQGRDIVLNNLAANCVACHQVENKGGSAVGPDLSSIGKEKDARYLLESIVAPSAVVSSGYGLVTVTPKEGDAVIGTLLKEEPDHISLKLPEGTTKLIPRADITTMTPPMSVMPPMSAILTKRQIRDIVAYLVTQKGKQKPSRKEH
jgi:quinoprotein glucose dehydrogenase